MKPIRIALIALAAITQPALANDGIEPPAALVATDEPAAPATAPAPIEVGATTTGTSSGDR
jgi:hypothetical protein